MRYDPVTDHYVPVGWDEAFAIIGRELNALNDPDEAEFYTSGRTSNEAAFMYQLFARRFGTNNFPDCSNMCHEPTSVGLPESIGIGKGTVVLDDFAHAEAIFIIGQNPGTNSPRMLTELHRASRRNVPIVVFNPLRERALERFAAPQDPVEIATFGETRIASEYCCRSPIETSPASPIEMSRSSVCLRLIEVAWDDGDHDEPQRADPPAGADRCR